MARRGRGAGERGVDAPHGVIPARERATASYSKGFIALASHVLQRGRIVAPHVLHVLRDKSAEDARIGDAVEAHGA